MVCWRYFDCRRVCNVSRISLAAYVHLFRACMMVDCRQRRDWLQTVVLVCRKTVSMNACRSGDPVEVLGNINYDESRLHIRQNPHMRLNAGSGSEAPAVMKPRDDMNSKRHADAGAGAADRRPNPARWRRQATQVSPSCTCWDAMPAKQHGPVCSSKRWCRRRTRKREC